MELCEGRYSATRTTRVGVLLFDNPLSEKAYAYENEVNCWHYSHANGITLRVEEKERKYYQGQGEFISLIKKTGYMTASQL